MSVIISGMEMPKCCADCDLLYDYIGCSVTGTHADFAKMDSERLPDCPLREMKERGRMSDLINRSELKKAVDTWDKFGYTAQGELIRLTEKNKDLYVPYVKYQDIVNCIDNAPAVGARPRGEWNCIQAGMFICPFCGAIPHKLYKSFCPNCGADMRKR